MIRTVKTGLKKCGILFFIAIFFLGTVSFRANAETAKTLDPDLDTVLTSVSSYILNREPDPEFDSVWMVLGMARSGLAIPQRYFDQYYSNVIAYCEACDWQLSKSKYTEFSKAILGLTAIGVDAQDVMGHNLFSSLSDFSNVKKQGISGPIWTLISLNANPAYEIPIDAGASEQTTEEGLIQYLLEKECADGGWTLAGNTGYCDITAMVLTALAPYYGERDDVTAAVDRGIAWLSENQDVDGSFPTYGSSSSESCSQVIVALSTLGIDCGQDSRFIKNSCWPLSALLGFYLPEGGFMHVTAGSDDGGGGAGGIIDGKGTEQGFYAVVSYERLLNGENTLFDMSDITLSSGTEPVVSSTMSSNASSGTGASSGNSVAASSGTGTKTSNTIRISNISLNYDTLTIKVGNTKKLKATVSPANATNSTLKWKSSDESVATVTQKGKVTALKAGTTTIKAKATDGSGKKATCKVTVKKSGSTGNGTAGSGSGTKTTTGTSGTSGTSGTTGTSVTGATASPAGSSSGSSTGTLTGAVATASSDEDAGGSGQVVAYPADNSGTSAEESGWSFTGGDYVADSDASYYDGEDAYIAEGSETDAEADSFDTEAINTAEASIPAMPAAVGGVSEAVLIGGMFLGFRKHNFVGTLIHAAAKVLRGG